MNPPSPPPLEGSEQGRGGFPWAGRVGSRPGHDGPRSRQFQLAVRCIAIYRGAYLGFPVLATEGTMATGYNVRVGDADREATAAQLREHFADGRLTLDELNERLDQTFAAKTKADLNTVMRDLPHAVPTGPQGTGWQGPGWQGSAWPGPMANRSNWDYRDENGDQGATPGSRRPFATLAPLLGHGLALRHPGCLLPVRSRWRRPAIRDRAVPRGARAVQAAARDGQAARPGRTRGDPGPAGTASPLVIVVTYGFRAGRLDLSWRDEVVVLAISGSRSRGDTTSEPEW